MKNKSFGLDIGIANTKVVWLTKQNEGYMLNSALSYPTPPKGILSESPLDQEEMARAIKKIVTDAKIISPYVNIAISESQVYTKVVEMPSLSDKELSSAIYWEAEQHIPVPLNSISLDWKVLRKASLDDGGKMEVLLVGAPNMLIDKYQKILSLAGLMIVSVETEILSTIRALIYSQSFEKQFPNSLIVSIGAMSTSLAIVKDNILSATYSIAVGGNAIDRAIASDFGFSTAQAEEYKKAYGVSEKFLGGKIGRATTPILNSILSEIKKALVFYGQKYKEESPIQQVLLSGGTAKLPGIDLFFAQNCGVETAIGNPWHVLANQNIPKEILDNAPDYTVAVGLALREDE